MSLTEEEEEEEGVMIGYYIIILTCGFTSPVAVKEGCTGHWKSSFLFSSGGGAKEEVYWEVSPLSGG